MFVNFNKLRKIIFLIKISKFNILRKNIITENYNFEEFKSKYNNKKIALVGNSKNLLKKDTYQIDSYEVVIRLNLLPPKRFSRNLGKKCDVLMMSHSPINLLNSSFYKVWMSPKNRFYGNYAKGKLIYYPLQWWDELYALLGSRPSTGMMAIDFLTRVLSNPKIDIFGMDHKYENAWYTDKVQPRTHDFKKESSLFKKYLNKNIKYIN